MAADISSKISTDVERHKKFQSGLLGIKSNIRVADIDIRNYAKYILREGSIYEKQELIGCLQSRLILKDKTLLLER